jgi:hypothetical protein
LRLLARQPFPHPIPFLPEIRHIGHLYRLLGIEDAIASRLSYKLADRRQPDINRTRSDSFPNGELEIEHLSEGRRQGACDQVDRNHAEANSISLGVQPLKCQTQKVVEVG